MTKLVFFLLAAFAILTVLGSPVHTLEGRAKTSKGASTAPAAAGKTKGSSSNSCLRKPKLARRSVDDSISLQRRATSTVGVAVYDRGLDGSYHWALVVTEGSGAAAFASPVRIFQIDNMDAQKKQVPWFENHRDSVTLSSAKTYIGTVHLGSVSESASSLSDFIKQFPADQGECKLPGSNRWSCAWWSLQVVDSLTEAELLSIDMKDQQAVYNKIIALGMKLANHKKTSGAGNYVIDYMTGADLH